jgi:hypothetical protein
VAAQAGARLLPCYHHNVAQRALTGARCAQAALAVGDDQLRPVLPPDAPAALATLAAACFEPMPEHRPSFALIAHHMRKARGAPGALARRRGCGAVARMRARSLCAARVGAQLAVWLGAAAPPPAAPCSQRPSSCAWRCVERSGQHLDTQMLGNRKTPVAPAA